MGKREGGERKMPVLRSSAKQTISCFARLPSGPCVGTAQTEKEGAAMRRRVFVLLVALALVLLLASDAM